MIGMGGRTYFFDSTEFIVEPSVTDYGMRHEHVANGQGASNVYPWLNHNVQVADLDDSRLQDTEDHAEGNDKMHRTGCHMWKVVQHPSGMEQLKGKQQREFMDNSGKRGCSIMDLHRRWETKQHIQFPLRIMMANMMMLCTLVSTGLWQIVSICPHSAIHRFRLFVLRRPVEQSSISMTVLQHQ